MAKQTISGNLNALKTLIEPFGWSIDGNAVEGRTGSTLKTIQEWCEDEDSEDPCPGSLWGLVSVPYEQRKAFRDERDVLAFLFELFAYRADFGELAKTPDAWMKILADNLSHGDGPSKFGSVHFDEWESEMAVWFGGKTDALPWKAGDDLRAAISTLLVPTKPTVPTPKSTNRRTLATPPAAASVSGPGLSKKTRMVAKKEKAPLIGIPKQSLEFIDIDCIESDPENDRKTFDQAELQALADSIAKHGILQPINLRPIVGRNAFMIVAGERRWRAARLAGLKELPAQISDREGLQVSVARLEENLRRVDLSPIEKAMSLKRLMDTHGLKQKEVGELLPDKDGKPTSQGQISNMLRLLNLPEVMQKRVADLQIAHTLVRPLLPWADLPAVVADVDSQIEEFLKNEEEISVSRFEMWVETAVEKHTRSMTMCPGYRKPKKADRCFEMITKEQELELDLRGDDEQKRACNVKLFDQINKDPLSKKLDAYKKKHAVSATKSGGVKASSPLNEYSEYRVRSEISESLLPLLIKGLNKNSGAVDRVLWALAVNGCFQAVVGYCDDRVSKIFGIMSGDAKQNLAALRKSAAECLKNYRLPVGEIVMLAKSIDVDVVASWKASKSIVDEFTLSGLQQVARAIDVNETLAEAKLRAEIVKSWPAGYVPAFLNNVFGIKGPAKAKKSKAA